MEVYSGGVLKTRSKAIPHKARLTALCGVALKEEKMKKCLKMYRGDSLAFDFEVEGLTVDLKSAYFSCKSSYSESAYVFHKSIGDGVTKTGTGKYHVRVAPDDTKDINPGKYYYDLQLGAGGDIYTVLSGTLEIMADVTRS